MWFKHSPTKQAGLEPIRGCTRQYETRIRMIDSRNIAGFCKRFQETTTGTRIDSGTALLAWEEMPIHWWQLAKILVSMFGNVILKPAATNITAWTRGTSEFPSSCKSLNLMPCLRCCRFGRCREVKRLSLPSIQVTSCWFTSLPKDYQGRNPDSGGGSDTILPRVFSRGRSVGTRRIPKTILRYCGAVGIP